MMNQSVESHSALPPAPRQKRRPPTFKGPFIKWTDAEWLQFARTLHERNPAWNMMASPDLVGLNTRMLNAAGATMDRPRVFSSVDHPRKKLLAVFAALRESRFSRAPTPAEPATPLARVLDGDRPRLVKNVPPAELPAIAGTPSTPSICIGDWTRDEWLLVVRSIHAAFPVANYPSKAIAGASLTGLDTEDVAFAQRVLPFERQVRHLRVVSFTSIKPALLAALRDLHNRLVTQAQQAAPVPKVAKPAPPAPAALQTVALAAVHAAPAPAPAVDTPPASAPVSEIETVMAPVLAMIVRMLAAQIRPLLADLALELLPLLVPAGAAPPLPAPVPVAAKRGAVVPVAKVRPPTIGVYGNRGSDKAELEREFPNIEFIYIESTKRFNSIRNCDKVAAMTSWVDHAGLKKLKGMVGDRFTSIEGGNSELKRLIHVWIASGAIAPHNKE